MSKTPIFLLSLPRSGSTLLQRIFSRSPDIATVSEPWILLPLMYANQSTGSYAEYGHRMASLAIVEFQGRFESPNFYRRELEKFVINLYSHQGGSEKYFLDKTPRYHLICEEIYETFPGAKFIFLWRNPLAISASIINSWGDGNWNIYRHNIDLYTGMKNLIALYRKVKGNENVAVCTYEDLVSHPEKTLANLSTFLGVEFPQSMLQNIDGAQVTGTWGDKSAALSFTEVTKDNVNNWSRSFSSPTRKRWARKYLEFLGGDDLSLMGYSFNGILNEVNTAENYVKHIVIDPFLLYWGKLVCLFELPILKDRILKKLLVKNKSYLN